MKFHWILLLGAYFFSEGYSQLMPRDPPQSVNIFFSRCFNSSSRNSRVDWRSIIDFSILHTSWFENSDVGACAPNNPDVIEEANCWKEAFGKLISPSTTLSRVAGVCVDHFVAITRQMSKRSVDISLPFIPGNSLDNPECPVVDAKVFTDLLIELVERTDSEGGRQRLPTILEEFLSVIEFVKNVALCTEPTCDLCDLKYRSTADPSRELMCNECWPTRLAGMVKNSSALKKAVTNVAEQLGNNHPNQILPHGPPPAAVNQFFATCLSIGSENQVDWQSITDFLILHTSWYDNSNVGLCSPTSPNLLAEANCWKDAFMKVISSTSNDLPIINHCVDSFVVATQRLRRRRTKRQAHESQRQISGSSLDSEDCPFVDVEVYNRMFLEAVALKTSPGDFLPTDKVLQDFLSVIQFVKKTAICTIPTCDACDVRYTNAYDPTNKLLCNECWPTRLAGMIKKSSPLKNASMTVTIALENLRSQKTKINCESNQVDISVGSMDLHSLRLTDYEKLIVWGSPDNDVDNIDEACVASNRTNFSFQPSSCQPVIQIKNNLIHYTYTIRKVFFSRFSLTAETYYDSTMNVTCSYNLTQTVTAKKDIFPVSRRVFLHERRNFGNFDISLGFYDNRLITRLPKNSTSFIPRISFMSARIDTSFDGLALQALQCWATRYRTERARYQVQLVRDGCPLSRAVEGIPQPIVQNGESEFVRFQFRNGVFSRFGRYSMYIHCLMRVCNSNDENCRFECNHNNQRARREVNEEVFVEEANLISTGPFFLDNSACKIENGGCTDICSENDKDEVICSCRPGRTLYSDRRTCLDNQFLEEMLTCSSWPMTYYLYVVIGVLAGLLGLLTAVMFRRKTK